MIQSALFWFIARWHHDDMATNKIPCQSSVVQHVSQQVAKANKFPCLVGLSGMELA